MLARCLTTILLAMTLAEALEKRHIHSVAVHPGACTALVTTRPCRAPSHHLRCGADRRGHIPMPGDVSPAHDISLISRPAA